MAIALPDFMARMFGFADKVEANLTAETKLAEANARIAALEKENAEIKAADVSNLSKIDALIVERDNLKADLDKKNGELSKAATALSEAKATANAVIAGQGLSQDQLPTATITAQASPVGEEKLSLTEQCLRAHARSQKN